MATSCCYRCGGGYSDFQAIFIRGGPRHAVRETAHWLEWQDWANRVLQRPYEVKDGKLHIPDVAGLGLERDEKAIVAHLAETY